MQLRHSQRLLAQPLYGYENDPVTTTESLFTLAGEGSRNLHRFVETTDESNSAEMIHFSVRSGRQISVSRRKLFVHVMIHAIRHWAQISTLLRQNGFHPAWGSDSLDSKAMV